MAQPEEQEKGKADVRATGQWFSNCLVSESLVNLVKVQRPRSCVTSISLASVCFILILQVTLIDTKV